MKKFNFDYDSENDDLFVYLEGSKSKGAVETGNFVFDFNEKDDLVAIQITEASKVLKALLSKLIQLSNLKDFRAEVTNFRNMASIKFTMQDNTTKETANIMIPRVIENSPALNY